MRKAREFSLQASLHGIHIPKEDLSSGPDSEFSDQDNEIAERAMRDAQERKKKEMGSNG